MLKKYVIRKNKHSSGIHFYPEIKRSYMLCSVKFDASCIYSLGNEDQKDINKLFGWSHCFYHKKDSVRWGWRCKEDKIEAIPYVKNNFDFYYTALGCILDVDTTYDFIISLIYIDNLPKYIFTIFDLKGIIFETDINVSKKIKNVFGYRLYPYFGGTSKAPHDMKIYLDIKT
jgi:hypothetical protein